ncbi:hypothetical protein IFM89_001110, partial [Coptis chinensis]
GDGLDEKSEGSGGSKSGAMRWGCCRFCRGELGGEARRPRLMVASWWHLKFCFDGGGCQLDMEEPNSNLVVVRGYVDEVFGGSRYIDIGTGTMQTVITRGIVFIPWHEVVLQRFAMRR